MELPFGVVSGWAQEIVYYGRAVHMVPAGKYGFTIVRGG